jgi:hypothetical protein
VTDIESGTPTDGTPEHERIGLVLERAWALYALGSCVEPVRLLRLTDRKTRTLSNAARELLEYAEEAGIGDSEEKAVRYRPIAEDARRVWDALGQAVA